MGSSDPLLKHLESLHVNRLGPERPAGLWICSLPLPENAPADLSLAGNTTYGKPLGQWPGRPGPSPRRLLMVTDAGGRAPDTLPVATACDAPDSAPPTAEARLFAKSPEPLFVWERHALRISWGGRSVEFAMGLRTKGEVHWWEACRLVVLEETPTCRVIEMGGAIPLQLFTLEDMRRNPGYKNPFLHHHNWLNGHIYARLHANGVCEIYAHHINSKFFDDGLPLEDAVAVIGMRAENVDETDLCGPWDGSRTEFDLGGVRFDVADAAHLSTPDRPGRIDREGEFLAWQPYAGVELYGGLCPNEVTGDDYIFHTEDRVIPRGMSRTLRFSLSLSDDRPPTIVRYLAPAWWYGACEEFRATPVLPVVNDFDGILDQARDWISEHIRRGGFEDGSVPRHAGRRGLDRHEPGWEGEIPYGQFLGAWRSGDAGEYDDAMRSAWFFTDVCVDHAAKQIRMHGYPPNAFALPMARVLGTIAAYLETGEPYLLNTAEAVIETAYRTHKNSWPRMAVGRDACFIRGAVMLYRFLGYEYFREKARDALRDVFSSQREEGSFGDQGGGSGIHQWGAYITKPWMGLMAVGGAIDYLELFPEDEPLAAGVKAFADWLMLERYDHDGVMGWGYQHAFNGRRTFFRLQTGEEITLPGEGLWHVEYLARLMMFCTIRFGVRDYFDAWAESHAGHFANGRCGGDHGCAQVLQFIPWLQSSLWRAQITTDGVVARPLWLGDPTPRAATILTPAGPVQVNWTDGEQCAPADGIELKPETLPTGLTAAAGG